MTNINKILTLLMLISASLQAHSEETVLCTGITVYHLSYGADTFAPIDGESLKNRYSVKVEGGLHEGRRAQKIISSWTLPSHQGLKSQKEVDARILVVLEFTGRDPMSFAIGKGPESDFAFQAIEGGAAPSKDDLEFFYKLLPVYYYEEIKILQRQEK
ncbi:MAG: hypothetical protein R3F11_16630 [Verrucomicrobiales bacterium]